MKNEATNRGKHRRHPLASHICSALVPIGLALTLQGCATLFSGTTDEVHFTSNPPGGSVVVDDETYDLPATVEVSKKLPSVTFVHPEYPDREVELARSFQGGYLLMDVLFTPGFGLSGILIDTVTSSWNKLEPMTTCDHTLAAPEAEGEVAEVTAAIAAP